MLRKIKIVLCLGSSCFARGNQELVTAIRSFIVRNQLEDFIDFKGDHCFGSCSEGPNLYIGPRLFNNVSSENVDNILEEAISDFRKNNMNLF